MQASQNLKRGSRQLILFDLDETLIHAMDARYYKGHRQPDFTFPDDPLLIVFFRDLLIKTLAELYQCKEFDIGCFTAGTRDYAEPILGEIERQVFAYLRAARLSSKRPLFVVKKYRDDCTRDKNFQYKDLTKIENYSLDCILLVDDLFSNFQNNQLNGMPIKPYNDVTKPDYELAKVLLIIR